MEQEIWKPIKGYEGYFMISNLGRVKALKRYVKQGRYLRHCCERIVPHHLSVAGYPSVTLCKEKKSKEHSIHRLIMEAFVPNPENKPHIDHINTDKTDFRLSNLRWVTPKENSNNPLTLLHCRENTYTEERSRKIVEKMKERGQIVGIYQYTKDGVLVSYYESKKQAERETGVSASQIKTVLNDNTQSAGGFMWFTAPREDVRYERRVPKNAKEIVELDDDGNEVKKWKMLKEAANDIGVLADNIRIGIKNNRKVKGHFLKYVDDARRIEPQ